MTQSPPNSSIVAVTGAFSYSGAAIARELLDRGRRVRTLTGHPDRAAAGGRSEHGEIDVRPLSLTDDATLAASLSGVDTLINTYWVRFEHSTMTFDQAVANSGRLFNAAARAGVRRIVHVSITHPDLDSPYPYFRGKANVERLLEASGISHAILRPAILFGGQDVLINNIAWLLRRLPVFAIGGHGRYRVRGIHVQDLARLCVDLADGHTNTVIDAVGPESLEFIDLVRCVRRAVRSKALLLPVPGKLVGPLSAAVGALLHDTLLTRDEYGAMSDGLANSEAQSSGDIVFSDWVTEHGHALGRRYANELVRHYRPEPEPGISEQRAGRLC